MKTQISTPTQFLLESFRLLEQSRAKYYDYLDAVFDGDQERIDIFVSMIDPAWNAIREKILNEDIMQTVYDWANAEPEKAEI
jgi:hypothetical protein